MDHSLQGYIARQSSEMLWDAVSGYMASRRRMLDNRSNIVLILRELEKRDKAEAGKVSPRVEQAWTDLIQRMVEIAAENFK